MKSKGEFLRNGRFWNKYFVLISLFVSGTSCVHEFPEMDGTDQVCFQTGILPVFVNSCATAGCHDAGTAKEGYDFSEYVKIMETVTPYDARGSKAYQAITGRWEIMPPAGPLSKETRTKIWLWIEQGAQETRCITDTVTPPAGSYACFGRDILPVLVSSCAMTGCHDNVTHRDGINLTSYQQMINSQVVKASNPGNSKLYKVISLNASDEDIMPPKPYSPLSKAVIDTIYKWIQRGALNETCISSCDTTGTVKYSIQVSKVISVNCITCHSGTSAGGGIRLTTFAEVANATQNGRLLPAVRRQNTTKPMPPSASLSKCDLRTIELWVKQNYQQ